MMKTRNSRWDKPSFNFLNNSMLNEMGEKRNFWQGCLVFSAMEMSLESDKQLHQYSDSFRFYQTRNEQSMVHTAAAFAKMNNRLRTFACTTSIGPGATNMITGAAGATITDCQSSCYRVIFFLPV